MELAGLEDAQELRLLAEGHVRHLVAGVPWSPSSKQPVRSALASVKAPLTWPNSSLSNTPSLSAPAFTGTNGFPARWLMAWMRRATTSLPSRARR